MYAVETGDSSGFLDNVGLGSFESSDRFVFRGVVMGFAKGKVDVGLESNVQGLGLSLTSMISDDFTKTFYRFIEADLPGNRVAIPRTHAKVLASAMRCFQRCLPRRVTFRA